MPVTFLTLLSATIFSLEVREADALACSTGRVRKLNPSPHPEGSPVPFRVRRLAACLLIFYFRRVGGESQAIGKTTPKKLCGSLVGRTKHPIRFKKAGIHP